MIVAGGGVIGSAVAYFLVSHPRFDGSVAIVERDPSYAGATTPRSVGGIRQQFSTRENILLSAFAAEFIKRSDEYLAVDGVAPSLGFVESGYLFLVPAEKMETARSNHTLQTDCGARVALLDTAVLTERFPWLALEGVAVGSLGLENEGWIDPHSLLMGFKASARALGVHYLHAEVTGVERRGDRIAAVHLASGETIGCGVLVNAAGAHAARLAAMADIGLPVSPRKRQVYVFECKSVLPGCPLVIDPSGLYFRPESGRFLSGISPPESEDPDASDHEIDYMLFETTLWPILAARVPAFEAIRLHSAWACTYAYNTLDRNAIVGPHPEVANFFFANGFSGHGLQQSPGVGRAVAELIVDGGYQSIDLRRFGFERILEQRPLRELNVV